MTDQQPTAEEQEQLQEVGLAGATAAGAGEDPAAAMKDKRDELKFVKLSDEDIDAIAKKFNELNIAEFAQRGAFDPQPEPVAPPAQPVAPEQPGVEPVQEPAAQQPAVRSTYASRWFGGRE